MTSAACQLWISPTCMMQRAACRLQPGLGTCEARWGLVLNVLQAGLGCVGPSQQER